MDLRFENPHVILAVLALLSVSAACLCTLYLRDERRGLRAKRRAVPPGPTFIRLSDYRRDMQRRDRPAA
jgi:hypothetical protein